MGYSILILPVISSQSGFVWLLYSHFFCVLVYYRVSHVPRMLGRDELQSLVQQCIEILEHAKSNLTSSPPALEVIECMMDVFRKYLEDLNTAELKQEPASTDKGNVHNHAVFTLQFIMVECTVEIWS